MSTLTSTRPGTPIPTMGHPSLPPFTHRRTSNPIHFSIPFLPSRTPPSLLKRSASSSTSSPSTKAPRYSSSSPTFHSERRESVSSCASSTSSASSGSGRLSPILSTPVLRPADESAVDVEILLDTPSPQYSPSMSAYTIQKPTAATPARPRLVRGAAVPLPPVAPMPTRPKMTRRDTPRPSSPQYEEFRTGGMERQGSYTSIVDGGKWVVV